MTTNQNSARMPWVRVIGILAASLPAFWLAYWLLLKLFPEKGGGLSEFGTLLAGYLASLLSSSYVAWLSTGQFLHQSSTVTTGGSTSIRAGFLGSPLAISLLSASWLSIWLYVSLLKSTLHSSLLDGTLGFTLSTEEAARISANLNGLLALGVVLPLLSATAFIAGWACSTTLRFKLMTLPSGAFLVIAAFSNYGAEILRTGNPPILPVLQEAGYISKEAPTLGAIGLFWFLYLAGLALGIVAFAAYGRIWTFIGFKLRRVVAQGEG